MRRIHTFIAALLLSLGSFAQTTPEMMSYQAVVRDADGQLVSDTVVGMRISILQNTTTGTAAYVEIHTPISNENGLVSIEIGMGDTSYDFSIIDWSTGPYFIKTETDPTGGSNYTISGTSQLMSVPFALHAKVAESVSSPVYSVGYSPELGGYVFMVSADGEHGLVCETIDQGFSSWYNAQNVISNPSNHSENGQNFTDWRVPTRYELAQMFSIKADIIDKNGYQVPVFEVKVSKNVILHDQNKDLLKQENETFSVDGVNGPDIVLGSMTEVSTNGNWPTIYDAGIQN